MKWSDNRCCGHCHYWFHMKNEHQGDVGACLRYPPRRNRQKDQDGYGRCISVFRHYPQTSEVHWCGDFKEMEE